MSEFIGSRISLVSRSDIRYVGILHEINAENSTVALENVTSFGTEGRKNNPDEEIPPSDSVYEYIVFRGSDVKDLRIEEAPAAKETKPPQVPNDPAILGSGSRPTQAPASGPQSQQTSQPQVGQQAQQHQQGPPQGGPPFGQHPGQHPQYAPFYHGPPQGGWGRGGPPPGPGYPGMSYGAPPGGWYPPPGQGFPPPQNGQFPPYGYPPGPPSQQFQQGPGSKPPPIGPGGPKHEDSHGQVANDKQAEPKSLANPAVEMAATAVQKTFTPPVTSTATTSDAQASQPAAAAAKKAIPTGPKNGRVQPALPLHSPLVSKAPLPLNPANTASQAPAQSGHTSIQDATQAASAAVAAAMAKLEPAKTNGNAVDNLTKKVQEMRTSDAVRHPRQPAGSGFAPGRGRGRGRGGSHNTSQKIDVPAADFDFEESNAKFNKQDLVKEAIAGASPPAESPMADPTGADDETEKPAPGYNKSTSFFDNISSENKGGESIKPGGREWRGEEQKKNVETFGQGSVDNGYRGGFRGRGRGRGYRGRGFNGPGRIARGGFRGARGDSETAL